jgi:cytochrome c-type biogenesis protein
MKLNILTAFVAGILSFASPCVLPIIPAYISTITGISIDEIVEKKNLKIIIPSILFIVGFTIAFILLQVIFSGIYSTIKKEVLNLIFGLIIIIFGIHLIGIIKIKFLYYQKGLNLTFKRVKFLTPFLIGFGFGFAWTPCIGPILGSILVLASQEENFLKGIILLLVYSFGLGIPFLLAGIFIQKFLELIRKYRKSLKVIEIISGVLLIFIGILVLSDRFYYLLNIF